MLTVLRHHDRPTFYSSCELATGRSCVALLIKRYRPTGVLMPAYAPEGLTIPFETHAVPIFHYNLLADLQPDVGSIAALDGGARPIIIVIHYFGYFAENMAQIAALAHDTNALLFEDCAHALIGINGDLKRSSALRYADVSLFSLNKFLPLTDGAMALSYRPDIDLTVSAEQMDKQLDDATLRHYARHLNANQAIAGATNRKDAEAWAQRSSDAYEAYYKIAADDLCPRAMSKTATSVKNSLDWHGLAEKRDTAARFIADGIADHMRLRSKETVPLFAFPIITSKREAVRNALLDNGVMPAIQAKRWGNCAPSQFSHEKLFIDGHLLLPLDIDQGEAALIVSVLDQFK